MSVSPSRVGWDAESWISLRSSAKRVVVVLDRGYGGIFLPHPNSVAMRMSQPRFKGRACRGPPVVTEKLESSRPGSLAVPLVPPFEREVFKAPDCFLLRHRSTDHRGRKIECEVLRAAFREEINRSVDKGRGPRTALPWHPLSKSAAGSRRGRRRSTSHNFISVRPTIPTSSRSASTMLIGGTGQERPRPIIQRFWAKRASL